MRKIIFYLFISYCSGNHCWEGEGREVQRLPINQYTKMLTKWLRPWRTASDFLHKQEVTISIAGTAKGMDTERMYCARREDIFSHKYVWAIITVSLVERHTPVMSRRHGESFSGYLQLCLRDAVHMLSWKNDELRRVWKYWLCSYWNSSAARCISNELLYWTLPRK